MRLITTIEFAMLSIGVLISLIGIFFSYEEIFGVGLILLIFMFIFKFVGVNGDE